MSYELVNTIEDHSDCDDEMCDCKNDPYNYKMTELEVLKKCYLKLKEAEDFSRSVPNNMGEIFWDNPVAHSLENCIDLFTSQYFSNRDEAEWVLVDWRLSEQRQSYVLDGIEYRFVDIDDLCEFLKERRGWT